MKGEERRSKRRKKQEKKEEHTHTHKAFLLLLLLPSSSFFLLLLLLGFWPAKNLARACGARKLCLLLKTRKIDLPGEIAESPYTTIGPPVVFEVVVVVVVVVVFFSFLKRFWSNDGGQHHECYVDAIHTFYSRRGYSKQQPRKKSPTGHEWSWSTRWNKKCGFLIENFFGQLRFLDIDNERTTGKMEK